MFKRIIGIVLVIVAVVSLALSLVSTVAVWRFRKPMAQAATAGLRLLDETLGTTTGAFAAVEGSLQAAGDSITAAQDTFETLSQTVATSGPTLGSLSTFLEEGLPSTLKSTQQTLEAAAQSAQVIDDVLATLSQIPLFGISYDPSQPLGDSLAGIGSSLEALPNSLGSLGSDLGATSETLPALADSLGQLGQSMEQIQVSLTSAEQIMVAYKDLVGRYQAAIRSLEAFIPAVVSIGPIVFTFFAFWLAVVQLAALLKGWAWLRGDEDEDEARPAPKSNDDATRSDVLNASVAVAVAESAD